MFSFASMFISWLISLIYRALSPYSSCFSQRILTLSRCPYWGSNVNSFRCHIQVRQCNIYTVLIIALTFGNIWVALEIWQVPLSWYIWYSWFLQCTSTTSSTMRTRPHIALDLSEKRWRFKLNNIEKLKFF